MTVAKQHEQINIKGAILAGSHKVGSFTIMATPSDIEALAVGFISSEGLIDSVQDCQAVSQNEKLPNVVGIEI